MFSFLLGGYLEVELLSHKVTPCSGIWGTAWLSSKVAKPFYISTSSLTLLLSLILTILVGVE